MRNLFNLQKTESIPPHVEEVLLLVVKFEGRIPFYYLDRFNLTKAQLKEVNHELRKRGTLEGERLGIWEWFQASTEGMDFIYDFLHRKRLSQPPMSLLDGCCIAIILVAIVLGIASIFV